MHTLQFKKRALFTSALIFFLSTFVSYGQDKLGVYLRFGHVNPHAEVNGWLNSEANVGGGQEGNLHPILFGADLRYKVNENWLVSTQIDLITKYRHMIEISSNRYISSNQIRVIENADYSFAPILLNTSIQRDFHITRGIYLAPKVGIGLRMVREKGNISNFSIGSETLNHAKIIKESLDNSFKKIDPNFSFGFEVSHQRIYASFQYVRTINETALNQLSVEGEPFDVRLRQSFGNLVIGYRVW